MSAVGVIRKGFAIDVGLQLSATFDIFHAPVQFQLGEQFFGGIFRPSSR
jgi:hypothetical protein